jgi:hypothetical protein
MNAPDWAKYIRPDEVAECWDGVLKVNGLYEALWSLPQTPIPNLEDSGPHDHVGHDNLAQHWSKLSEEHRIALIRLDKENHPDD